MNISTYFIIKDHKHARRIRTIWWMLTPFHTSNGMTFTNVSDLPYEYIIHFVSSLWVVQGPNQDHENEGEHQEEYLIRIRHSTKCFICNTLEPKNKTEVMFTQDSKNLLHFVTMEETLQKKIGCLLDKFVKCLTRWNNHEKTEINT